MSTVCFVLVGLIWASEVSGQDGDGLATDADIPFLDPSENSGYFEGDILEDFQIRSALNDDKYLWPNGIIPYIISDDYDKRGRVLLARAIQRFHNNTCVRFVPRTVQTDYIYITPEGGCASYIGRIGGVQGISLGRGCYSVGIMQHELMHSLGFVHEQNRPDRDDYLDIQWDNVKDGHRGNFVKLDWYTLRQLNESYDYSSILHYGRFAFSKDPRKKPTMVPKKKRARIGQRKDFSAGDVRKINKLYNCRERFPDLEQ